MRPQEAEYGGNGSAQAGWRGPDGACERFHSHQGMLAGCQLMKRCM